SAGVTGSGPADLHRNDLARLARGLAPGQGVDVLHAPGHLAPDGVLAVEIAGVVEADEELAVGRVRIVRPGHRADAAHMRLAAELGLQVGLVRTAAAGAGRIAALGHEAGDDAVEDDAVIKALARQFLDPRHVAGSQVGAQAD